MRPAVAPVPGIVLAAGASTRLGQGRAKQLLELGGRTLVCRAAEAALAAAGHGVPVVVVLGHRAEECTAALAGLPVRIVVAARWDAGMGASLKAGLDAVLAEVPKAGGIAVSLCDQPFVTAEDLRVLRDLSSVTGYAVAAAEYGGVPGVPAVFGRETFGEIRRLADSAGAKGLLARHAARGTLRRLPMPGAAVDVDTPADLVRWPEITDPPRGP